MSIGILPVTKLEPLAIIGKNILGWPASCNTWSRAAPLAIMPTPPPTALQPHLQQ